MTKGQRLKAFWQRIDIFVLFGFVVVLAAAGGAGVMNWINSRERGHLVDRFPVIRAEERAACVREFASQIDGLKRLNTQAADEIATVKQMIDATNKSVADTNEIVAYTLRFLGDRARIADAHAAAVLKQTREAAAAATAAQHTTAQVERKVNVAATKADEAASTAQAVSKKLDTATRPALPAKPWVGSPH